MRFIMIAVVLIAVNASAAEAPNKDLQILQLQIANRELAIEHMEQQREILAFKLRDSREYLAKLKAEFDAKTKKDSMK